MISLYSSSVDILRIDCVFPAGTAYQQHRLVANAANSLLCEGTLSRSSHEVAEFLDYRGIALDTDCSFYHATITCYVLRKYADELLPLLHELLTSPAYGEEEFRVYCDKRRQQLLLNEQKTAAVARNKFYLTLYGPDHPLGPYATPDDVDRLSLDEVRQFFRDHYKLETAQIFVAGHYDEGWLSKVQQLLGPGTAITPAFQPSELRTPNSELKIQHYIVPSSVQSTIRVGRRLPFRWDDPDYHRFMVLNTVLGGYFGSRLMSNIREDKGYTYGIYSRTLIFGPDILFTLSADVSAEHTDDAVREVFVELQRLCDEPIPDDELAVVRQYMEGDYLRSVDGIFERMERRLNIALNGMGEEFTDLYLNAIRTVTPAQLQSLAQRIFVPDQLLVVSAGPGKVVK